LHNLACAIVLKQKCEATIKFGKSKAYRKILGPVYDNEKENWRILSKKEIYAILKKPTITETIRLHRLLWFRQV
jgi:hypothetical protein